MRDTNLYVAAMLESPRSMLVTGIRCVFLEPEGDVVPLGDRIYWQSVLRFYVNRKSYWESPVGHVIDAMFLQSEEAWRDLSISQKRQLQRTLNSQLLSDRILKERILNSSLEMDSPSIDGVMISQQECFEVTIEHDGTYPERVILCALDGITYRSVL